MKMSHIYQPVMLSVLLHSKGKSSVNNIAKEFTKYDQAQIEYYKNITKIKPGKVLVNNLSIIKKNKNIFKIENFSDLSTYEIQELNKLCELKIKNYINKRGKKIWEHRKKSSGLISNNLSK